jgi:AraC-like DNA-binding protein
METDQLYLNPTLTVPFLAEHTGLTQKNISAVLNQHLHKSFSDFVNEYRVNAIKEKLLQGGTQNLTIAGLAYDCGFNSIPTFQRAFKTILGLTPREFLSKNASSSIEVNE